MVRNKLSSRGLSNTNRPVASKCNVSAARARADLSAPFPIPPRRQCRDLWHGARSATWSTRSVKKWRTGGRPLTISRSPDSDYCYQLIANPLELDARVAVRLALCSEARRSGQHLVGKSIHAVPHRICMNTIGWWPSFLTMVAESPVRYLAFARLTASSKLTAGTW